MSTHDEPTSTSAATPRRPTAALARLMVALFLSIALWSALDAGAGAALVGRHGPGRPSPGRHPDT